MHQITATSILENEHANFGRKPFSDVKMRLSSVHFSCRLQIISMIGQLTSKTPFRSGPVTATLLAICLVCGLVQSIAAQTVDAFGDSGADPVKLFEQGQNAHARADRAREPGEKTENYNRALGYYDEAIKVRPDFPEAEFQRAAVLTSMGRLNEAETGLRRVLDQRKDWSLPYSALGVLLLRLTREKEAEPILREAIRLSPQDTVAIQALGGIRLKAGDAKEALQLATRAIAQGESNPGIWFLRALAERGAGENKAALVSLDHVLELQPQNFDALIERAEIRISEHEPVTEDLKAAENLANGEKRNLARVAAAYQKAGRQEDAERVARSAGLIGAGGAKTGNVIGTPEEINLANSDDPVKSREALEKLLKKNPDNAVLLARLGAAYRTVDSTQSLNFYRRALELDPTNPDFATGYSSALVQARHFADAVAVLRKVVMSAPGNYAAHANLATALYELKQFPEALSQYEWLLQNKPDLTVAHYFIATAHDNLREYQQALASYETFLAHADSNANQLEIEKVKLRLPSLRRQIQKGEGVKQKSGRSSKN